MLEPNQQDIQDLLPSYGELRSTLAAFKRLVERDADFDALVAKARLLTKGFAQGAPVLDKRHKIYRGVTWPERPTHVRKLTYPPAEIVKAFGRAHKPGKPMFYGSPARPAPFYELRAKPGEHIVISRWGFEDRVFFNSVGYSEEVFTRYKRTSPTLPWWHNHPQMPSLRPANKLILRFLAREFARDVAAGNENEYRASAAITEALIGGSISFEGMEDIAPAHRGFGGIIYPSLAMRANADNVAIFPEIVERFMRFEQAEFIRVDAMNGHSFSYQITELDFANSLTSEGIIEWKGRIGQWTIPPDRTVRVAVEDGQYVVRDEHGQIVDRE